MIEGLETPKDAAPGTRHVAFYSKVHHAAVDGEAGVALAQAIMDVAPEPRHVFIKPEQAAAINRQRLIDAITKDETAVQHRDLGLVQRAVFTVEVAERVRQGLHRASDLV